MLYNIFLRYFCAVTVETRVICCLQASSHEGSKEVEKAFILQLLGVDGFHNGKEVIFYLLS